ncbi:MAG: AraC family transcriptional regulator [Verrucomicrobiae bacterium]|nr:AraC family transcriptional regulator [Verrucomicrobiae bacterium]
MGRYRLFYLGPFRAGFQRELTNRRHRHSYFEVCLVTSGRGLFTHDGEEHALKTGDLFVAWPEVYHEISSFKTRDLVVEFFSFSIVPDTMVHGEEEVSRVIAGFLEQPRIIAVLCGFLHHYFDLFSEGLRESGPDSACLRERLMGQLLLHVMTCLTRRETPLEMPRHPGNGPSPGTVSRALLLIERNLSGPLRVGGLARECGVSERQLRRLFDRHLGQSVHEEINRRRYHRARLLLTTGDFNIEDVALQVGVESPAQFSRWFRRCSGESPREFPLRRFHAALSGWGRGGPRYLRRSFFPGKRRSYRLLP